MEAVPSYNTNKTFHPRASGWVGFVITAEGRRIYYPGDTDVIPEMDTIRADIVVIPVGGTYTMTAAEAADAVSRMKPVVAVPIHYGDIVGSLADAKKFKEYCKVAWRSSRSPISMLFPGTKYFSSFPLTVPIPCIYIPLISRIKYQLPTGSAINPKKRNQQ